MAQDLFGGGSPFGGNGLFGGGTSIGGLGGGIASSLSGGFGGVLPTLGGLAGGLFPIASLAALALSGGKKPFSSVGFDIKDGFVSPINNAQKYGGQNLLPLAQSISDLINSGTVPLPEGVTSLPSLLAGHKGLGPSFVTQSLLQSPAQSSQGGDLPFKKSGTHIRLFPETGLNQFTSALVGNSGDIFNLSSGVAKPGIANALGVPLGALMGGAGPFPNKLTSPFAPGFTGQAQLGREGSRDTQFFNQSQLKKLGRR